MESTARPEGEETDRHAIPQRGPAWVHRLAAADIVLPEPLDFQEHSGEWFRTAHVSDYARRHARFLRLGYSWQYAGWEAWPKEWWQARGREAMISLECLRVALDEAGYEVDGPWLWGRLLQARMDL